MGYFFVDICLEFPCSSLQIYSNFTGLSTFPCTTSSAFKIKVLSVKSFFFVAEFAPLFFVPFLVALPEAEKLTLSLCCHKDRPSIWKTVYFECLSSGKHFLEQVLVSVPGIL